MRILLAHNSRYFPAYGGGDKSNRLLMEALAARGHVCRVVARLSEFGGDEHARYLEELRARDIAAIAQAPGVVGFEQSGVEVRVVTENPHLRSYFASQIADFRPNAILNSTDDPAQMLLEAALAADEPRVVYLARATLALPFGPDCAFPSAPKTELLRQVDGVVGVSRYVADYIRRWSGIPALALPISLLDPGPYAELGRFNNEFVTLVNPCAVKGISVFLALARSMPGVRFAAVPTWGTNPGDRAALEALPNVCVLEPVDNIDELLARTRVLLVPSLWAEARSRIVVEAMLRGVPVVASDVGGIPEAKLGVPYLLPVRPIEKYSTRLDERMVPVADVREQDIRPWTEALGKLLADRAHYEEVSRASREAALAYAANLTIEPFERFMEETVKSPRRVAVALPAEPRSPLDGLSPDKRRLLALRVRKKSMAAGEWFPGLDLAEAVKLRLFAFPHAGAGLATFRDWSTVLPAGVALQPVRLPGRESRIAEPPFTNMVTLIDALARQIEPLLAAPFAFFGHSMGAAVAFELARRLRSRHLPLPKCLFVSAARAPHYRLNYTPPPEPSDAQLVEELRQLGGVPGEALASVELLQVVLPALRADATLYRNYVYLPELPLDCSIRAYGGAEDSNITREHLEGWRCETRSSFALRILPGGHFFIQTPEFRAALAADVVEMV